MSPDEKLSSLLQVHGVLLAASGFLWSNWISDVRAASTTLSTDSGRATVQRRQRGRWFSVMVLLVVFNLAAAIVAIAGVATAGYKLRGSFSPTAATALLLIIFWLVLVAATVRAAWSVRPGRP